MDCSGIPVVILAGGKGTRMGNLTAAVPKPMVPLAGKPILDHQIELAGRYGLRDIIILTGHLGDVIESHYGDGSRYGVSIRYNRESKPLGTAGSVREIASWLDRDFFVWYGDTIMDIDLPSMLAFHHRHKPAGTLLVHPNDHPYDSDILEMDDNARISAFHPKPRDEHAYVHNLVNAALYILSPTVFDFMEQDTFTDFARDIFPKMISGGTPLYAYKTPEYIKDVGTPHRLAEVEADMRSGKIARLNKRYPRAAVFFDRDGVINEEVDCLSDIDQFRLLDRVPQAVKLINSSEYLAVAVTNQPAVAKGFLDEPRLDAIHAKMETLLGCHGAYFDGIYYCPHHPHKGFEGERPELKIECDCRKPNTGMIGRACADMHIDAEKSFMIGDRTVDIQTGINAGMRTILLRQGYAGSDGMYDCTPDYTFSDLYEAADFIVQRYPKLAALCSDLIGTYVTPVFEADPAASPVIAIGGLARSGKSTLASVMYDVLCRKGIDAQRLSLDAWILDHRYRTGSMDVRQRFDYETMCADLEQILHNQPVMLNRYDARTRTVTPRAERFQLNAGQALVIDGCLALDVDCIQTTAALRVYTAIAEPVRKDRFYDFYRYKGLPESEVDDLYAQRQIDESPVVSATQNCAHRVIDMEDFLR